MLYEKLIRRSWNPLETILAQDVRLKHEHILQSGSFGPETRSAVATPTHQSCDFTDLFAFVDAWFSLREFATVCGDYLVGGEEEGGARLAGGAVAESRVSAR